MFEGSKKWMLSNQNSIILVIIALAGILRGYNLGHGTGFHPDERGIQMIISNISWDNLNPQNFHYGSFAYYLCWLTGKLLSFFWPAADSFDSRFYIGRIYAVSFGCIAVGGLYLLAKQICFDYRTPFVAAFFLATNIFHLQLSRFYTVDILLTTISVFSLYYCCRLVGDARYNRFFGICLGLAFTNKISALTLLVPYFVALLPSIFSNHSLKGLGGAVYQVLEALLIATLIVLIVEPFLFLDFEQFISDNKAQIDMVKGLWVPPYTLQYVDTAPYLYHLKQMFFYTIGLPLAPLSLLGLIFIIADLRDNLNYKHLVILSWFFVVYFSIAGLQVKFPRYLLPLYPLICFFGAYGLIGIFDRSRFLKRFSLLVPISVLAIVLLQAVSWIGIYSSPHSFFTASKWIYQNIPANSKLAEMHWDDRLPLELPGEQAANYQYLEIPIYEQEDPVKINNALNILSNADFLVLSSGRPYGAFPHVAGRYPFAIGLFKKLFTDQLGYKLVSKFKTRPWIPILHFNDELADESFSLYDHPKVTIFKNERMFSHAELAQRIQQAAPFVEQDSEMFLLH